MAGTQNARCRAVLLDAVDPGGGVERLQDDQVPRPTSGSDEDAKD